RSRQRTACQGRRGTALAADRRRTPCEEKVDQPADVEDVEEAVAVRVPGVERRGAPREEPVDEVEDVEHVDGAVEVDVALRKAEATGEDASDVAGSRAVPDGHEAPAVESRDARTRLEEARGVGADDELVTLRRSLRQPLSGVADEP